MRRYEVFVSAANEETMANIDGARNHSTDSEGSRESEAFRLASVERYEARDRLPALRAGQLSPAQRALATDMMEGIANNFQGFISVRNDGALLGPWNAWLHYPKIGLSMWELTKTVSLNPSLPPTIRQIAILVTAVYYQAQYELYAHRVLARQVGLSEGKITAILAHRRTPEFTVQEIAAYDFTKALLGGGVVPDQIYRAAVSQFGPYGVAELSHLVGLYCIVSITLNTFDVRVPAG